MFPMPDKEQAVANCRFWAALSLTAEQKHGTSDPLELERLGDDLSDEQVASRWIVSDDPAATGAFRVMAIGLAAGVLVSAGQIAALVWQSAPGFKPVIALATAFWLLYLGLFPTSVAFTLWAFALGRSTAGRRDRGHAENGFQPDPRLWMCPKFRLHRPRSPRSARRRWPPAWSRERLGRASISSGVL